jgi:alkylhydroperoxidase family enzyme
MTNYEHAFEPRPEVYAAWRQLITAVKSNMDERRFELATLAAAVRLRCSYCSLAHGVVLQDRFGEDVLAILRDRTSALGELDIAVMELAEQVADDANATDAARARLRDLGLTDEEVMDVVLAASIRAFFSKTLDGLGVLPDASYLGLDAELREALTVGRPIATS